MWNGCKFDRIVTVLTCTIFLLPVGLATAQTPDYPIRPVPLSNVEVRGEIWAQRINTNHEVTIPSNFRMCELTGRIDNFSKAGKLKEGSFQGRRYDDSDVFKVIEGACYSLAKRKDPKLDKYLDELIEKISAAQESDGYLYTCRTIDPNQMPRSAGDTRWSYLAHSHELYNVGHLFEAAVAHFEVTGKRSLLNVAVKNADLINRIFGPNPDQRKDVPGHQEIEIGLVKLYRATDNKNYLDLAKFFLDQRGKPRDGKLYGEYSQDHQPLVLQKEAVGHAVRALYMYCAMADIAAITGDKNYSAASNALWEDIVYRKMYLTGGVGSSRAGEAFGPAYDLPNASAYNETCAAIGLALLNHRMFRMHGNAKYIDVLERIIYNGFLAGVSLDGDEFFYPNPLACDGRTKFNQGTLGRSPWFSCSCCPVNISRFVPSIAEYIYAMRDDEIFVNLYVDSRASLAIQSTKVALDMTTRYPRDGNISIGLQIERPTEFIIRLRIPGWAQEHPTPGDLYKYLEKQVDTFQIDVNGKRENALVENGYVALQRRWKTGDLIDLKIPMPIRRVKAHKSVVDNQNKLALERGPLVYCIEAVDHGGSVHDLFLPDDAPLAASFKPNLLGGLTVINGQAMRVVRNNDNSVGKKAVGFRAIPYYAWAHREIGEMAVWIPRNVVDVQVPPAPTIASTSKVTASHTWTADTVNALNDQIDPKNSADHSLPRHTWWDHRGSREWAQFRFAKSQTVSAIEVYWFDDTGRGSCRVPESWRLTYHSGDGWKPVKTTADYTVAKDRFNELKFEPVTTNALRLEVQLQREFSGGLLEWRVR